MELVGALEDARNVETERRARLERRKQLKKARESVLSEVADKLSGKLHLDDPTQYKEKVWQKINESQYTSRRAIKDTATWLHKNLE